jgi:hypothetical protein
LFYWPPTISAAGNLRHAYFAVRTAPAEHFDPGHLAADRGRHCMKRIVNLPMALRRSKLRHSARPPDSTLLA